MKKTLVWWAIIGFILLTTMGCAEDETSVENNSPGTVKKSFNFTMSSYPTQKTRDDTAGKKADFTADQIMTGQLTALNTDTSVSLIFDWSVYFDETTWEAQSNKTIVLTPGNYEFFLLLTKGDYQYAGSAVQEITDGTADVPMIIRPVIGDTVTDVNIVAELADFKFQYDPTELATVGFSAPQLGIIVDGGAEVIFALNPATGITYDYANLPQGTHQIQLKLYDGSLQKGRSVVDQETVIVTPGLDIVMNLVALHGETTFDLAEAGGDAFFQFTIPAEVIDEAGGTANLEALFTTVGTINTLQENALTLTPDASGDYESEITLSGLQYEDVTISLAFSDLTQSSKELLGSCSEVITLDVNSQTVACDITLRKRAVFGGSILAALGINAFNTDVEPVAGATIYNGTTVLGITGSGAFGTAGYLKVYLNEDTYTLKAESGGLYGQEAISLSPLEINNLDIVIDTVIP